MVNDFFLLKLLVSLCWFILLFVFSIVLLFFDFLSFDFIWSVVSFLISGCIVFFLSFIIGCLMFFFGGIKGRVGVGVGCGI